MQVRDRHPNLQAMLSERYAPIPLPMTAEVTTPPEGSEGASQDNQKEHGPLQPLQPATGGQPTMLLQQPQPGQMQPQHPPQPAIGGQAPAASTRGQPKPPQQQLGSQGLGHPQPQQQPKPAIGEQGVGPTTAAKAGSSAGQQPTAPAMTQHQQQPQPSSGGQGLTLTAPAGISTVQPPKPQQQVPATGGQGPGPTAPASSSAGQPQDLQQPQPATSGQAVGHIAPAGISAAQPPKPQLQVPKSISGENLYEYPRDVYELEKQLGQLEGWQRNMLDTMTRSSA